MCGLVGIFDTRGRRPMDTGLLRRMNDSLAHRGPDGDGLHVEPGIGLGHRRLAIIDLEGGHQPLANEDGRVVVVFNGEIFNFAELTERLEAAGHVFRTRSDTEVIVHAWEEWGEACVERFRGMFAFALWDGRAERLFLARDRFGIKPLYWGLRPDGLLLFGSELKALLEGGLARDIDPQAVEDYFAYGYVPEPRSIYRAAAKLPPGHTLLVERGAMPAQPRSYWTLPFAAPSAIGEQDAAREVIERLREAVRIRLISEVPLGAFLSGGVDSSAVVSMMAQESASVKTCSIGFDLPAWDESAHAEEVARLWRTDHVCEHVGAAAFDLVDRLARAYDEPFADSSAMPTWQVCALARKRVTVALSGDGGDELFAGYRRYRWFAYEQAMRDMVPSAIRRPVIGALARVYPKADWAPRFLRAKSTLEAMAREPDEGYFHSVSVVRDSLRGRLLSPGLRSRLGGYHAIEVLRRHMAEAPTDDPLARVQYADMRTYLPGDILTKVDRASMAHGLEVRVPFLDHPFAEYVWSLPTRLKYRGGAGKVVLRHALAPYLPDHILNRPKQGFAVPLAEWFRGPLRPRMQTALLDGGLADSGLFDMGFVRRLVDSHLAGVSDHGPTLWSLLMFEAFLRNVHNAPQPSIPALAH